MPHHKKEGQGLGASLNPPDILLLNTSTLILMYLLTILAHRQSQTQNTAQEPFHSEKPKVNTGRQAVKIRHIFLTLVALAY